MRTQKNGPTLKKIAEIANVSVSTVSRVLNNPKIVDESTREKVLDAIQICGYNKKTNEEVGNIAVLVPDLQNPHFQYLVSLLEKKLRKYGYLINLCIFDHNSELIDYYLETLMSSNVSGCIMASAWPHGDTAIMQSFIKKVPTISFQSDLADVDTVYTSDEEGTLEMLELLYQYGHKKIGFIGYITNEHLTKRRQSAYRHFHEMHNLPLREDFIGFGKPTLKSGYEQACRILCLKDRPTAIHCFNTFTAMGVYIAIREYHLRIPEDISVSAFDETPLSDFFFPPISVISQPIDAITTSIVDLLIKRIKKESSYGPQTIRFPTTLIRRQSIGFCPENERI